MSEVLWGLVQIVGMKGEGEVISALSGCSGKMSSRQWHLIKEAKGTWVSGAEHGMCKGPEVGVGLARARNSEETRWWVARDQRGRVGDQVDTSCGGFLGVVGA